MSGGGMQGGYPGMQGGYPGMQGGQGGMQGMMSGMGGGFGPFLQSLFGGGKNPADAAMGYLNKIPGTVKPYYNPYINAGQNAMGVLQGQYGQMVNDPAALMNKFGSQFQQSPGYQFQVDQATNAANNQAAAGGLVGSPAAQMNTAQSINGLANQDYGNYMNRAMGLYGQGIQGYQGLNQMGYNASDALANMLAQNLQNQGNLSYMGQDYQNQQKNGLWGALGNLGGMGLNMLSGGGMNPFNSWQNFGNW